MASLVEDRPRERHSRDIPVTQTRLPYFAAAMSRNQRIGLVVGALIVAIVAFVVAQPGGDDDSTPSSSGTPAQATDDGGTDTETETQPEEPAEPAVTRISVKGGVIAGDVKSIEVAKGDTVRIVVSSDVEDEIHLHGYDLEREAAPGKPARFKFEADVEGAFEIESHVAEDAGKEPLLARLLVGPS
jgi:FtsP/CotA-like multicopper oxidase with cupredoxin domain